MNVNILFLIVLTILGSIFFLFEPIDVKQKFYEDTPLFELQEFILYELNTEGLTTLMSGGNAARFSDRYEVQQIDYTDNSREYIANMKANKGLYKDDVISLDGDIVYIREDGLTFKTQKVTYDKKTNIALAPDSYTAFRGKNRADGKNLKYDNVQDLANSSDITATYILGDKF